MTLGWYVHHHGRGHAIRAMCVLPHVEDVTVLTSVDGDWPVPAVRLGLDGPGRPRPTPRGRLHHAPLGIPSATDRAATLVRWFDQERPGAVVVDVSVEVTLLARLCGIPSIVMRMHGWRTDAAHLTAFDAAVSLLAPYPPRLEDPSTPAWVRARTTYVGGFSRFDHRQEHGGDIGPAWTRAGRHVVAVSGSGGAGLHPVDISAAAAATPDWTWHVLGPTEIGDAPSNVDALGWVDDTWPHLRAADVVVAGAGDNTVMEVAAACRPLVCVPEERPFDEQGRKAGVLGDAGLAVVSPEWPPGADWPSLLDRALGLDTSLWRDVVDGDGTRRAAEHIQAVADAAT